VVAALPLERLRTGVAVTALEPLSGGSVDGPRYRLRLDGGGEEAADAVVLATPAFAAGDLLRTVAPAASAGLGSIPYVSTATVSLAFERGKVRWPLQGFGFVVPRAEERGIMAATFSSSKFDGRAPADGVLWRAFVGRAGREEALSLDDAGLVALVRRELRDILDLDAEPLFARVFRWPRGMPQYRVGHGTLIDRVERDVAVAPGVEVAGGYVHGIGIGDCLREGRAAAQRALAHVADVVEPPPPAQPVDVPAGDGITD
jgi:oxygen-dependent protoporphyrinogen oxidase